MDGFPIFILFCAIYYLITVSVELVSCWKKMIVAKTTGAVYVPVFEFNTDIMVCSIIFVLCYIFGLFS